MCGSNESLPRSVSLKGGLYRTVDCAKGDW